MHSKRFCRLFFAFLVMLPMVMHLGFREGNGPIKIYLIRTVSGIVAMWTWFYGTFIPIGEQTALSFLALFTTVGAAFLLRETVRDDGQQSSLVLLAHSLSSGRALLR